MLVLTSAILPLRPGDARIPRSDLELAGISGKTPRFLTQQQFEPLAAMSICLATSRDFDPLQVLSARSLSA